ncbi:MAG: class I SAM-dependent methyltransferase [Chloroflexota bacterium]
MKIRDQDLPFLLNDAFATRADFVDERHEAAFRLFNGFLEGCRELVVDVYGKTAVIHNYAKSSTSAQSLIVATQQWLRETLPWLDNIIVKTRHGKTQVEKRGQVVWQQEGTAVTRHIREHGVRYTVDLTMNRDCSFYLDTRNLRRWAIDNLANKTVLNTFAYTGSLGVAAIAGGAKRVVHVDLNRQFLNVAKTSYTLNGFPINKKDFQTADFWPRMNKLKRAGEQFDCVFIDPPFFSATSKGVVDLSQNTVRLINKVRPLVKSGGHIIAINNAIFYSGQDYMAALNSLCEGGYVEISALIPAPPDFAPPLDKAAHAYVTNPAPFNHSTKIASLTVYHRV